MLRLAPLVAKLSLPGWALADQSASSTCREISKDGMSLGFSSPVFCGQYVTGDWWAQAPVTVVSTSPAAAGGRHGFEKSPSRINKQPYDDRAHYYDASLLPTLPLTLNAGDTLVKAKSNGGWNGSNPTYLQSAMVMTIVASPPPADAFRPAYFRPVGWQPSEYQLSQADWSVYPSLAPPEKLEDVSLAWVQDRFSKVQLDHLTNWAGHEVHPTENMPRANYGQAINTDCGKAATRLLLDDDPNEKRQAAVGFVQYGLDIAAVVAGGGGWPANGGWDNGRKIAFAVGAFVLGDAKLQNEVKATTAAGNTFAEDGELNKPKSVTLFGSTHVNPSSEEEYWKLVVTENGEKIMADPYQQIDGGAIPGGGYDFCCTYKPWKGSVLPLLVSPGLSAIFNSPHFVEFVVRRATHGSWAQPDSCAPPTGSCSDGSGRCSGWSKKPCGQGSGKCQLDMQDYGVTWGPSGAPGKCIEDTDPSDGVGRFPDLHGANKDAGGGAVAFVEKMWAEYGQLRLSMV